MLNIDLRKIYNFYPVEPAPDAANLPILWEKLFPEKRPEPKREMVVLVTPKLIRN